MMLADTIWLWVGFNLFVLAMLALVLGVFHRHAHHHCQKGHGVECGLDKFGVNI